ncbi:hypothetical protein BU23DRAFT_176550 [Bimuria novae-zelandiae CBS 107.79]|uniref:Uncharacterized protein n=1 Tax=Bimuria novae-zelandiae CBS 107.79 TaxID=1447943 RepID=A0A6A5V4L9_9PLEO|nr:hypothetical protein BU23DRAFT_176550 [Bimuria novae-zelandiae CBS 107.79]
MRLSAGLQSGGSRDAASSPGYFGQSPAVQPAASYGLPRPYNPPVTYNSPARYNPQAVYNLPAPYSPPALYNPPAQYTLPARYTPPAQSHRPIGSPVPYNRPVASYNPPVSYSPHPQYNPPVSYNPPIASYNSPSQDFTVSRQYAGQIDQSPSFQSCQCSSQPHYRCAHCIETLEGGATSPDTVDDYYNEEYYPLMKRRTDSRNRMPVRV